MTPEEFHRAAHEVLLTPRVVPVKALVKNYVGNLAIMDQHDQYVGWIDLVNGEVHWAKIEKR